MALADAAGTPKLPRLFLVHNEGTQNQIAAEKRVAISVANDNNRKSCHSDQHLAAPETAFPMERGQ
jgi:hypothetical protein